MSAVLNTLSHPCLGKVDAYPVGLRYDLGMVIVGLRFGQWSAVHHRLRYMRRDWRRRSYWNGWLAEPYDFPAGLTRCGRGWTRVGAMKSLARRIQREAMPEQETIT